MQEITIDYRGKSKVIKRLCQAVNWLSTHSGGGGGGTGFFTFEVDDNGDLWMYTEDGAQPIQLEYDSDTGNLYYVMEED